MAEDWLDSPLGSNLQTFTYKYDTNSNIISADDGFIRYEYSYEERDLEFEFDRLSAGEPTVSFVRKYNDVGNLTEAKKLVAGVLGATTSYE